MNKYEIIIILLVLATMVWWSLALWSSRSASIYEWVIDKQQAIIQELRQTDRENCINLFLNDKI